MLEGVYEECLAPLELVDRGLEIHRQVQVPIVFKGRTLDMGYRLDMLVNGSVVLELGVGRETQPRSRSLRF